MKLVFSEILPYITTVALGSFDKDTIDKLIEALDRSTPLDHSFCNANGGNTVYYVCLPREDINKELIDSIPGLRIPIAGTLNHKLCDILGYKIYDLTWVELSAPTSLLKSRTLIL